MDHLNSDGQAIRPRIHIADQIRLEALQMDQSVRNSVEKVKQSQHIDEVLADTVAQQRATNPEILARDDEAVSEVRQDVFHSFDLIIALIALCQNVDDVERLKQIGALLGRLHKTKVKLNEQELRPRLKAVFAEIAKEQELHDASDRILLRRKVTAAITLINDSLSRARTK
jgi:hypothetical protein